jgi:hypothetical protein
VNLNEPSWLLLLWAGTAATLAASLVGAGPGVLIGARLGGSGAVRRHLGRFALAVGLGVAVYPLLYGLIFEGAARADLLAGLGLGAVHGLLAIIWRALRPPRRRAPGPLRLLAGHLVYGAVLGLLYIVPGA